MGLGGARIVRVPQEYIRRAEREHRNGSDNDQLPVHETTALRTATRYRRHLDIAIVKVRLIECNLLLVRGEKSFLRKLFLYPCATISALIFRNGTLIPRI